MDMTERPSRASAPGAASVGFVGLGNLGGAMTTALLDAGWQVMAYDVRPEALRSCVDRGATPATRPSDLAEQSVIALAVPDDATATAVVSEILDRGRTRLVVAHSTLLPGTARQLAEHTAARGVGFVDAPVSGGAERAASGDLTVMVGADAHVLVAAEAYLSTVGSDIRHLGPPGAGAATKLANQLMMFAALAGAHEAFELAAAYGVSGEAVRQVAATSTGDSWVARHWGFFDQVVAAYDASGLPVRSRPWSKDLWDVVAAAREADLPVPLAGLLAQHLPEVVEAHAHADAASPSSRAHRP